MRQSRQSLLVLWLLGAWAQCAAKPWVFVLPRIVLSRKHAAHLVHPQALAAANGIFESEYLGEPQLDRDLRRDAELKQTQRDSMNLNIFNALQG